MTLAERIERGLRAGDRFQQRHTVLGFPVGVVKKFGDDQAVTTIQGSGIGLVVGIVGTLWGGLGIRQLAQANLVDGVFAVVIVLRCTSPPTPTARATRPHHRNAKDGIAYATL